MGFEQFGSLGLCGCSVGASVIFFLAVEIIPGQSDDTLHQTFLVNTQVVEKYVFVILTYSNMFDMALPF